MRWVRPKFWAGVALIGLATVTADGFLPHTDDGCAFETHCLVCCVNLGHVAIAAPAVPLPGPALIVEWVHAAAAPVPAGVTRPTDTSRGPPLD